jgi:hypothetical protein
MYDHNVKRINKLGTMLAVTSSLILFTLMMEAICSSEISVLTRAIQCHFPEDGILHSHRHENLKSYMYIILYYYITLYYYIIIVVLRTVFVPTITEG